MSQKWEYLVEEIKTADAGGTALIINKVAEESWELLFVCPPLHYFRREKKPTPPQEQDDQYGAGKYRALCDAFGPDRALHSVAHLCAAIRHTEGTLLVRTIMGLIRFTRASG